MKNFILYYYIYIARRHARSIFFSIFFFLRAIKKAKKMIRKNLYYLIAPALPSSKREAKQKSVTSLDNFQPLKDCPKIRVFQKITH